MITIGFLLLTAVSPVDLENAGRLAEAGAAWEEQENLAGQVRIMGRLIEEAIYSGDGRRASLLVTELNTVLRDDELTEFWMARIAWSSGLSELAFSELSQLETDDPWLKHRASGLAALFREDGEEAVEELTLSVACASTGRRAFWSAVDLCSAYLLLDLHDDALQLSQMLCRSFPGDALGNVMYGLCLHASGNYSESFLILSAVDSSNSSALAMARALMEGFEQ
jgi:hypothetical protein